MSAGCCDHSVTFDGTDPRFKRALWLVIALNAIMFFVEMTAGVAARSQALQADALDFLGDSLTYGISLAVIGMALTIRARAALLKGYSLLLMGAWVVGSTLYRVFVLGTPDAPVMGVIGALALVVNLASVLILVRWKDGDANVRSVWLCSRNDAIGNVAVMLAASGVWATDTGWPDLIVAGIMAGLFLWSALQITRQARQELASIKAGTLGTAPLGKSCDASPGHNHDHDHSHNHGDGHGHGHDHTRKSEQSAGAPQTDSCCGGGACGTR